MNRIRINILLLLLCIFIPGVAQNVSDGWNKNRTARLTKPVLSITIGPPMMNCLITFLWMRHWQ